MNNKKNNYKIFHDSGFWIMIVIIFLCLLGFAITKSIENSTFTNNFDNTSYTPENKSVLNNPYTVSTEYDGIYKIVLNSDNGAGYTFTSIGIINFNNGNCKIKCSTTSTSSINYTNELEGFCGLNNKDNSSFYFLLNKSASDPVIYKCIKNENGTLSFELKSNYDLQGCMNKELNLTYLNTTETDFNTVFTKINEEEKAKKEQEDKIKKEQEEKDFKANCQPFTFEQLARNPEKVKGTNIKLTGEVIQALYNNNSVDLRVDITKKGEYTTYYTDTIYALYTPTSGEDKILEKDIITLYGTSQGEYSYTSTIGANVTLPLVQVKYLTINNK